MKGWLIYDALGAARNEWYIRRLIEEAEKHGLCLELKIVSDTLDDMFFKGSLPDFAIVRTIFPIVNMRLEQSGVKTFNNAKTAELACDKWKTYLSCREWGIPVLQTRKLGQAGAFPCVMKRVDGHGGVEVFWVNGEEQAKTLAQAGKDYLLQAPNELLGRDMRIYAVGGEIVGAVMRSSDKDFRSNFSLGGRVERAEADEEQKAIVAKLYQKLQFDYVGIDFLPTREGWVLNEIEDSAGARMLYQCTDVDIAQVFMRHVATLLR